MTEIRKLKKGDIEKIQPLENASFPAPWNPENLQYYLNHDHYYGYVAEEENEIQGFLFLSVSDQVEVDQIAVSEEKRNAGIGRKLLEKIKDAAEKENVEKAYLEVRRSNLPAIALYEKFGFRKIAERKNYYANPSEDALLYQKELN